MNWIINQAKEGIAFFRKEILKTVLFVTILFFVIAIIAWIVLILNPVWMQRAISYLQNLMSGIGSNGVVSAWDLFSNNLRACLITVAFGFIPFFFLGIISLVVNATTIGIVGSMYQYYHMSMALLIAGLLPHGIFEFPAIFISMALGFRTCYLMSKRIIGKLDTLDMKIHFFNVVRVFILIVIPLLIVAAFVEANITPEVMNWFI